MNKEKNIKEIFSSNLRYLREQSKESQLDLADAIVTINSPNEISQYEHGDRFPTIDKVERIAIHFCVTLDELLRTDVSLRHEYPTKDELDKIFTVHSLTSLITSYLFPIVSSNKALKDSDFKKGFEIQQKIRKSYTTNEDTSEAGNLCYDLYLNSYKSNRTIESAVNLLSAFVFNSLMFKSTSKAQYVNDSCRDSRNIEERITVAKQLFCFRQFDIEYEDKKEAYEITIINDIIMPLIKAIKNSKKYMSIADYYMAVLYYMGLVDNSLTYEMNNAIGHEMMKSLIKLDNKYAIRLRNMINEIISE